MFAKAIAILFIALLATSFTSLNASENKRFEYIDQNKESGQITLIYYDKNAEELLIRVVKTEEAKISSPKKVSKITEISSKEKYTVIDDRNYNLILEKEIKSAKETIDKYNKNSEFLASVKKNVFKNCSSSSQATILNTSGNLSSLANFSLKIADQLIADNNKIIFKYSSPGSNHIMAALLGQKGEILSFEFADDPKNANKNTSGDLSIVGPENKVAYLKKGQDFILKISTENFTNTSGDFIVTVIAPEPSRAEFIENLYHIVITGNKMTINPRQIIAPALDFSSEQKPSEQTDKAPFALGLQDFIANIVWGGGKEKTKQEIIKAGNDSIKKDPLLSKYLSSMDVERIAQKIVDEGGVISKDAISEKPRLTGTAYLYFSEALLSKAILEQMPMSNDILKPIVADVMKNFHACIKDAKFSGGVDDCKNKFAKTAVIKVARNIMLQQIEANLAGAISGENAEKDLEDIKEKGMIEFDRCTNKNITIPTELAEKNKTPLPDQMSLGVACVYSSLQYAVSKTVDHELLKTFKNMDIYREGDELLLTATSKKNDPCYEEVGITVDNLGRRYNMNTLKTKSVEGFKSGLLKCANKMVQLGARIVTQRTIEGNPSLISVFNDLKLSESQKTDFTNELLTSGYDKCMANLEKTLPPSTMINPKSCEGFITLKAKENAFRLILKKELSNVKMNPDPWVTDIGPTLTECSKKYFEAYSISEKKAPVELLTRCFVNSVVSAGYYIGGATLDKEITENPSFKPYGLTLTPPEKIKYQNIIKNCMMKELEGIKVIEDLTAIVPKTKISKLDQTKTKCTVEVTQAIVPTFSKKILQMELAKAIADEPPEAKAKLQKELDKIVDPLINQELIPGMQKIANLDDVMKKVIPDFKKAATVKAATVILDFKLSGFAKNADGKNRMLKVRDTLINDIKKELNAGSNFDSKLMNKVQDRAISLVSNTLIDQYLGTKYPKVAKTLSSTLNNSFVRAITEAQIVMPSSSSGETDIATIADSLGKYFDQALQYDPSITDPLKDLQKKLLGELEAQKKAGKKPIFDVQKLLIKYWGHPAMKKFILAQVSSQLREKFNASLDKSEAEEIASFELNNPSNMDLIYAQQSQIRSLIHITTSSKKLEEIFSTSQGEKALAVIRDKMMIPLLSGKEPSTADSLAITSTVCKTLTENRGQGSFAEQFTGINIQRRLDINKRKYGTGAIGFIVNAVGYKYFDWPTIVKFPSGQAALTSFVDKILYPSMVGTNFNMDAEVAKVEELVKKGMGGK